MHALDDSAKAFYHGLGFDESPLDPMTLIITLADLRSSPQGGVYGVSCGPHMDATALRSYL